MPQSSSDAYRRLYTRLRRFRDRHPGLQGPLRAINRFLGVRPPAQFEGWGMRTEHAPPWVDEHRWATFRETLDQLPRLELTGDSGIVPESLDGLRWRHWVVAFAVDHVLSTAPRGEHVDLVECGVADGVTAYVALRELERISAEGGPAFHMHLYDAWQAMRADQLLPSEAVQFGRYGNLSLDATRRNLSAYEHATTFHVGYVPATFSTGPPSPDEVVYVHVDLNAAAPTEAVCEHFWPRLREGGVMLFDDYGWLGFEDTKEVVDRFFAGRRGSLLKLPTAQAMFLKACA